MDGKTTDRLVAVVLDPASIERGTPDQEHERAVAIYDLLEENRFCVAGQASGPYALTIGYLNSRLVLDIRSPEGKAVITHGLSLSPFRRVVKDYFMICDSYYSAIRSSTPEQIEAIDMGRRGLHNEAAEIVIERLKGKIDVDFQTARRLFTLISTLFRSGRDL